MPSAGVLLRRFAGPWFGPLSTQGVRMSALWPQRIGTALLTPGCPSRMARWAPPSPTVRERGSLKGLAKLLGGLRHLLQIGRIFEVDRGVQLERVLQAQFLADLAHRRHDLLAEEADAGAGVLVRHRAVIAPDAVDARPGLFKDAAQFG